MNLKGSYRRLEANSVAAMVAAIEVYNKPRFAYRDEVVVVLTTNAWELLLKAILSKAGKRIFYRKKRGQPYRTLSLADSLTRAQETELWPRELPKSAVRENIEALQNYRDNAIHFYNERGFSTFLYALTQTSILNFQVVLVEVFRESLATEISWQLMPLGIDTPLDPLEFLRGTSSPVSERSRPVAAFLNDIATRMESLEREGIATDRFFTSFGVHLESVKKVQASDVVVGVTSDETAETLVLQRRIDPNASHPLRTGDVLAKLKEIEGLNSYGWQAVVWKYNLKDNPRMYWVDESNPSTPKWSHEAVTFTKKLAPEEVSSARVEYGELRARRRKTRAP